MRSRRRTCGSVSLPGLALPLAVDGYDGDVVGGQGGQPAQHGGGGSAAGHLGGQLAPALPGLVGHAVVDHVARRRLPVDLHALLRLLRNDDHLAGGRHCERERERERRLELVSWMDGWTGVGVDGLFGWVEDEWMRDGWM